MVLDRRGCEVGERAMGRCFASHGSSPDLPRNAQLLAPLDIPPAHRHCWLGTSPQMGWATPALHRAIMCG